MEHLLVRLPQAVEQAVEPQGLLPVLQRLRQSDSRRVRQLPGQLDLGVPLPPRLVQEHVPGNGVQPGPQVAPLPELPGGADGPEKGLLGQFLRYSAVPAQAQEVPLKLPEVFLIDASKVQRAPSPLSV